MSLIFHLFIAAAIISAAIYGQKYLTSPPSAARSASKTAPLLLLAAAAAVQNAPLLLVVALCLSAAGDFFLSLQKSAPTAASPSAEIMPAASIDAPFLAGLASFLAAHLAFAALFIQKAPLTNNLLTIMIGGALVIHAGMLLRRLWVRLGGMRAPVCAYALTIGAMTIASTSSWSNPALAAGVLLFVASDSLLAFDLFGPDGRPRAPGILSYAVWTSYFPGQLLIMLSLTAQ